MTHQFLEQQLDSLFHPWQSSLCPGAQILIRQNGQDIYEKNFGYSNLEHQIPITSQTIFHAASISKQFTVLSILLLWKKGLVDLDADIRTYVPDLIFFQEPVTVRQLMNNVSGLRDHWELLFLRGMKPHDFFDMNDITSTLKLQRTLNFPPQSSYLYCNMGFQILAVIAERVSKTSLPQFAREHIFEPLGMKHTRIRHSYGEIIPNLAYSYHDEGDGSYYYSPLTFSLYGPTSLNTCARDLSKMLDEYISPRVIDSDIISVMKTPAILSDGTAAEYCGGLMTHILHGMTVYEHGGANAAYRGHILCIPEQALEVIMLSNTDSLLMSKLARKAACIALGLPDCTEPEIPSGHFSLPRAGVFITSMPDDPQMVTILQKEDGFYMKRELGDTRLIAVPGGGYQVGTLDEQIFFQNGKILYRLPARVLTLKEASILTSASFAPGLYRQPETAMEFSLQHQQEGYSLSTLRYGSAFLYTTAENDSIVFSFGPDFTMYIHKEGETLVMDGYRVKHLICRQISR